MRLLNESIFSALRSIRLGVSFFNNALRKCACSVNYPMNVLYTLCIPQYDLSCVLLVRGLALRSSETFVLSLYNCPGFTMWPTCSPWRWKKKHFVIFRVMTPAFWEMTCNGKYLIHNIFHFLDFSSVRLVYEVYIKKHLNYQAAHKTALLYAVIIDLICLI